MILAPGRHVVGRRAKSPRHRQLLQQGPEKPIDIVRCAGDSLITHHLRKRSCIRTDYRSSTKLCFQNGKPKAFIE